MLPRSGSRPITVGTDEFRWTIATLGPTGHALVVESANGANLAIQLVCEVEGLYWLWTGTEPFVGPVAPSTVSALIELARRVGWDSTRRGRTWFKIEKGLVPV